MKCPKCETTMKFKWNKDEGSSLRGFVRVCPKCGHYVFGYKYKPKE